MLQKQTLTFLSDLKVNNDRDWFNANKDRYLVANADFLSLVAQLQEMITGLDPEVKHAEAKKCVFRIYRDIRFSPDKSPYKTHLGAGFQMNGFDKGAGYYFHVDPAGSFLSCGHYMLENEQLKKMRKGISSDFEFFKSILEDKKFKKEIGDLCRDEDALKKIPKGFDIDDPAAAYLQLKRFYVQRNVPQDLLFSSELLPFIKDTVELMKPLNMFLNDVLREE